MYNTYIILLYNTMGQINSVKNRKKSRLTLDFPTEFEEKNRQKKQIANDLQIYIFKTLTVHKILI